MQDIILDSGQKRRHPEEGGRLDRIIRGLLLALVAGLLWGLDFILYVRSGTIPMGSGEWCIPVLGVLTAIVFGVAVVIAVLFFSVSLQRLVFSLLCSVWVWGFMSQFLQIDKSQYLTVFLAPLVGYETALLFDGYSHWIVGGVVLVGAYIMAKRFSKKSLVYLAGILFLMLIGFWVSEMLLAEDKKPLAEIYASNDNDFSEENKKIVFLFMPALSSYGAIGEASGKDFEKNDRLRKVELGFFLKHGFVVYPNAYAVNDNKDANLIEILNILDNESFDKHVLNNVGLEKLWKFKSPQRTELFLKDNQMQDVFRKAGYRISAYQNQNIELCKKNNQYTVDRCVSKLSLPTGIDDAAFSEKEKADLLFKQWLASMTVFQNDVTMSVVKYILDRESVRTFSLPYEHLYVVDSVHVLQKLLENMAADKGAGVYFVYLDFPDDLLIYNEDCQVRPQGRWQTFNPKVDMASVSRSIGEYNEQVLCFWGQMEELMDNLAKIDTMKHLTIVMQGISGKQLTVDDNLDFIEKFKEQKSVLTAIRDSKAVFGVNNRICNSKDILRTYLFNAKKCVEFNGLTIAKNSQEALRSNLKKQKITKKALPAAASFYEEWLSKRKKLFKHLDLSRKNTEENRVKKSVDANALQAEDAVKALVDGLYGDKPKQENTKSEKNEDKVFIDDVLSENIGETEDVPLEYSENNADAGTRKEMAAVVSEESLEEASADVPSVSEENIRTEPVEKTQTFEAKGENAGRVETLENKNIQDVPSEGLTQEKHNQNVAAEVAENSEISQETNVPEMQKTVSEAEVLPVFEKNEPELSRSAAGQEVSDVQPAESTAQIPAGGTQAAEPSVSADFLIDENEEDEEWELDPAKALGVSGDEKTAPVEKIVVKVK